MTAGGRFWFHQTQLSSSLSAFVLFNRFMCLLLRSRCCCFRKEKLFMPVRAALGPQVHPNIMLPTNSNVCSALLEVTLEQHTILVKMQASQRKKRLVKARKKSAVAFFFVFSVHYAIIWHRCCSFSFKDATFWMEPGSLGARQNKNCSRCPELTSSLLCTRTPGSFYEWRTATRRKQKK